MRISDWSSDVCSSDLGEVEPETLDTIVVTGIRGSLISSMNLKRDAQGIVDGIVAEDIGKFPDTNLAESLQRISGVSIDRSMGEGSKVTVRGVGPDFNLVRSEEHTSELQSLMRISYAVFCLKKKT